MEWLQALDGNILLFIQEQIRVPLLDVFFKGVTFLGNGGWFWIVASLLLLIPQKTRGAGFAALLALALGFLITNLWLKNMIARPRPYTEIESLVILVRAPHDFSFPSGHACSSFAAAVVYFKFFPRKYGISAFILASLIAVSRLYIGVHYPSDVLIGGIIGTVCACAVCWMYDRFKNKSQRINA